MWLAVAGDFDVLRRVRVDHFFANRKVQRRAESGAQVMKRSRRLRHAFRVERSGDVGEYLSQHGAVQVGEPVVTDVRDEDKFAVARVMQQSEISPAQFEEYLTKFGTAATKHNRSSNYKNVRVRV